jgi:ELWxxDGT repeat protein
MSGFSVSDLTVINGEVLFIGTGTDGLHDLWVTNGTAAGTTELGGPANLGVSGGVEDNTLYPSNLTTFNGEVLFEGFVPPGVYGLWVSDGTAAGTHDVTGISGANQGGLLTGGISPDFTVFNGEVLFQGRDTVGNLGLWVTDGTAAGTHEVTGISGANANGLDPNEMTVFKREVLFNGVNAAGNRGLWVTDGTAAGTHELTGIKGASAGGLDPSDLTIFKNEVFFDGVDANGQIGLWVTNGTVNGTHEIKGITGA